jgi:rare lipoprotein A (peptidoglycan hydrolase)
VKVHSLFLKPVQVVASVLLVALVVATGAGLYPTQAATAATPATTGSGVRSPRLSTNSTRYAARISVASTTAPLTKVARIKAFKAVLAARAAAAAKNAIVPLSSWASAKVSWYGPGFYGHTMAGGGNLTPKSMVVAHRTMKFGTRIQITYNGKTTIAVVQDRGPFIAGRTFDLGPGTAKALGFSGVGTIKWRIIK